jgi:hypothetical protein
VSKIVKKLKESAIRKTIVSFLHHISIAFLPVDENANMRIFILKKWELGSAVSSDECTDIKKKYTDHCVVRMLEKM